MDSRAPSRIIASCFALSAFAIALISGLAAGRSASSILTTAVFALLGCYILGLIVSAIANVAINERIEAHRAANPIPDSSRRQPDQPQNAAEKSAHANAQPKPAPAAQSSQAA